MDSHTYPHTWWADLVRLGLRVKRCNAMEYHNVGRLLLGDEYDENRADHINIVAGAHALLDAIVVDDDLTSKPTP